MPSALQVDARQYLKPAHDPKRTPFLETMEDVIGVYQALKVKSPTVATAFAIGALAGSGPARSGRLRGNISICDVARSTSRFRSSGGRVGIPLPGPPTGPRS